jgi:hypothetical protein
MKTTYFYQSGQSILVILLCFLFQTGKAQVTYEDCVKGISYYIHTDKRTNLATITIDMKKALKNIYIENIVCYFYPIDSNARKLSTAEKQFSFNNNIHPDKNGNYTASFRARDYDNAYAALASRMDCQCGRIGSKNDSYNTDSEAMSFGNGSINASPVEDKGIDHGLTKIPLEIDQNIDQVPETIEKGIEKVPEEKSPINRHNQIEKASLENP